MSVALVSSSWIGTKTNRGQRNEDNETILYQTRDALGTVSLHDTTTSTTTQQILLQWQTLSQTFCPAAPCRGNGNLVVLPSHHASFATVRDVRMPPDSNPVASFHGANDDRHGMMTSVAMCLSGKTKTPLVSCGMESGSVFVHDMTATSSCFVNLGKDPILGLDLVSSDNGAVCAMGLAGDAAELQELPELQQGTVALVKAVHSDDNGRLCVKLRAQVGTCTLQGGGKPGVSSVRFRDDGAVFGIGGWDKRARLFHRTKSSPLAILKGHKSTVKALDFAPDASVSGLLATASNDGRINVWRCFPNDAKPVGVD